MEKSSTTYVCFLLTSQKYFGQTPRRVIEFVYDGPEFQAEALRIPSVYFCGGFRADEAA